MSKSSKSPSRQSIQFSGKDEVFTEGGGGKAAFADLGDDSPDPQTSGGSPGSPLAASTPVKGSPKLSSTAIASKQQGGKVGNAALDWLTLTYQPTPYTFRAHTKVKTLKRLMAKCPPYYLQLDHTLAVIWVLFSDESETPLGVAQLQWALNFLQGIYTRKGEHPKDVALCIQAIEDLLMEKYADMVSEVTYMEEDDKRKRRKRVLSLGSDSSFRSRASVCDSETCLGRLSIDVDKEIVEESELLIKQVPFSFNYSEMNEKAGADVEQLFDQSKSKRQPTDSEMDLGIPQENTMEFLRQWRRDQIYKIQAELKRLHSIETYIGCAETNFDTLDETQLDSSGGPPASGRQNKPKKH